MLPWALLPDCSLEAVFVSLFPYSFWTWALRDSKTRVCLFPMFVWVLGPKSSLRLVIIIADCVCFAVCFARVGLVVQFGLI